MTPFDTISLCLDLDGTIIDTAPDLVGTLNEVLNRRGYSDTDFNIARRSVGFGSKALILGALSRAGKALNDETVEDMRKEFLEIYANRLTQSSRPFPGVVETLKQLKRQGTELSICTNKPGYLARPLIDELGLSPLFTRIVGCDDVQRNKPHPDHIFASAGHRGQNRKIIMVGDSLPDVLSARKAGVPSIVMQYGYSTIPVIKLRADHILRNFREIPPALNKIMSNNTRR